VRNPPTTSHTPGSEPGCTIFVKLWQFDRNDRTQFRKTMVDELSAPVDGVANATLHSDVRETVTFHRLDAGADWRVEAAGGIELLVISGSLTESADALHQGSWLRLPEGQSLRAVAGTDGATVWMKTGHLPFAKAPDV
jgi:hypothetical protein